MDFSASAATKDAARLRRRRFCTPPRFFSTLPHTETPRSSRRISSFLRLFSPPRFVWAIKARTRTPRAAAASRARVTSSRSSQKIRTSIVFLACLIAVTVGESPASGCTISFMTLCTTDRVLRLGGPRCFATGPFGAVGHQPENCGRIRGTEPVLETDTGSP